VLRAVDELKYVPNVLAKTFRSGRDTAIGIAVPDVADPFFSQVTRAVEQISRTRGVAVFVTSLGEDPEYEQPALEALLSRQLIGLIIAPVGADQSYLKKWQQGTTMVFIDRQPHKLAADSVVEDDFGGARIAVTHLVQHGHRRIAFVGDMLTVPTTQRRLQGYQAALADAGIAGDPSLISLGTAVQPAMPPAVAPLLELANPPTAIFSSNARCSLQVVPQMHAIGRTDVALISFGDFPMADTLTPSVTVIDQNPNGMGSFAANRLFQRVDAPGKRLRRHTVLPVSLVPRGSCGLAPAASPGLHMQADALHRTTA
jgi:LacI family transcriptional regulator